MCAAGDTATIGIPSQLSIPNGTTVSGGAVTGIVSGKTIMLTVVSPGAISGAVSGQTAGATPTTLTWTLNGTPIANDTVSTVSGGPTWFSKWTKVNSATTTLSGIISPVLPQDGIQFTMHDSLSAGQACKAVNIFVYTNGVGAWAGRGRCSADGTSAESVPGDFLTWSAGRRDPHAGSYITWLVEATITDPTVANYSDRATITSSYYPSASVSATIAAPAKNTGNAAAPSPTAAASKKPSFSLENYDDTLASGDRDTAQTAKSMPLHSAATVHVLLTNTGDEALQFESITSTLANTRGTVLVPDLACQPSSKTVTLAPRTTFSCDIALSSPDESGEFIVQSSVTARGVDSGTLLRANDAWYMRSDPLVGTPLGAILPPSISNALATQSAPSLLLTVIAGLCTSGVIAALILLWYYRRRHPKRPIRIQHATRHRGLRIR